VTDANGPSSATVVAAGPPPPITCTNPGPAGAGCIADCDCLDGLPCLASKSCGASRPRDRCGKGWPVLRRGQGGAERPRCPFARSSCIASA
jgi:hypothetical protein